jgi:hypothetical protein
MIVDYQIVTWASRKNDENKKKTIEIELSEKILNTLFANDIIYAEIVEGGAVGCVG